MIRCIPARKPFCPADTSPPMSPVAPPRDRASSILFTHVGDFGDDLMLTGAEATLSPPIPHPRCLLSHHRGTARVSCRTHHRGTFPGGVTPRD